MNHKHLLVALLVALALGLSVFAADAQGPKPTPPKPKAPSANVGMAFTYQGQLKNNGALVNGTCAFNFGLWDDPILGPQYGITQPVPSLVVTNGLFTTQLDFGVVAPNNVFTGTARYLQVAVNCGGGLTALTPRQALTPAPMAFALPGLYTEQNGTSPNVIGGYSGNVISNTVVGGTIGGGGVSGLPNRVWGNYATVGGGLNNTASGSGSPATIGGGSGNIASGFFATISGGEQNRASGSDSTVVGGSNNSASGQFATILGGDLNRATEASTLAAGHRAGAFHQGAFVWGDSMDADFSSTANNQFLIRANGGVGIGTNSPSGQLHVTSAGGFGSPQVVISQTDSSDYARLRMTNGSASWDVSVGSISNTLGFYNGGNVLALNSSGNPLTTAAGGYLTPGGTWTNASDRNSKANLLATNGADILTRLAQLPISTWNYKAENEATRHMGPMAQDFRAAFGLGGDDKAITTVDEGGVALAAIQGLYQIVQERDAKIAAQQKQIDSLEVRLTALEQQVGSPNPSSNSPQVILGLGALLMVGVVYQQRRANRGAQ